MCSCHRQTVNKRLTMLFDPGICSRGSYFLRETAPACPEHGGGVKQFRRCSRSGEPLSRRRALDLVVADSRRDSRRRDPELKNVRPVASAAPGAPDGAGASGTLCGRTGVLLIPLVGTP
jgi:hypothetical protein